MLAVQSPITISILPMNICNAYVICTGQSTPPPPKKTHKKTHRKLVSWCHRCTVTLF
uniref:Uncharacterized protein n=1 Tax=Anguilla anguilla TaxID=7936 RepID=A0A0E9UVT4_ANGAN